MNVYTLIEWIAALAGLINVYLLTRQSILAWPAGLLSVFLYAFVFYHNHLFSDVILHGVYVVLNIYGWYHWSNTKPDTSGVPVSVFSNRHRGLLILFIAVASSGWGYLMNEYTQTDFAYSDAFILVTSLLAQYLLAIKKLENWLLWIIVDIVAIYIYSQKNLAVTAALYFIYLLLCILGYRNWSASLKQSKISRKDYAHP